MEAKIRLQRIMDILGRVQLQGPAHIHPAQRSGGPQQRVAIARALVAPSRAVLTDEPPSNLDDELRDELCGQILELHAQLGFTLVYVTHSAEEMRRIGTRAIRQREGREDSQ